MSRRELEFERLVDWAEGRLSGPEAGAVEERLAAAGQEADAEWLRIFLRVSGDIVLDEPPAAVREELERRFEAYAEGRRQPGPLRRLVATLASGGGGQQAAFGVRSAVSGESRDQLVYTTGAADIVLDLRRRPGDGNLDLDGQVFPLDGTEPDAFGVQLLRGASEVGTTATDELGEFGFSAVAPGGYQILVSSDRVEILISPVGLWA